MPQNFCIPLRTRAVVAALVLASASLEVATQTTPAPAQLAEEVRASIDRLIVVAGGSEAERELGGTYEKATPGLYGGAAQGGALGTPSAQVGPVTVGFPIPILTLPGMIAGGIAGATKRELQEFRDALAEELAGSQQPINNDKLARYVYQALRPLPGLDTGLFAPTMELPADADAVMHVEIAGLAIDIDGSDAVLTTAAHMTLDRPDGSRLHERTLTYQDRAALADWTADDHRLFTDYANFAMHYLGRELGAAAMAGADDGALLTPAASGSVTLERKDAWQGTSRALTPTLAWSVELAQGAAAPAAWDVEVYDRHRLVYARRDVPGASHALGEPLEACGSYRWSVRPVYDTGGARRQGGWMRKPGTGEAEPVDGLAGRNAAAAPAYVQDFATLGIHCKAT
ncbi:MAG TPA: hypothetical protein VFY03_00465 [Woeseiaceae bacterium]|nr:hypothetical protein [Woeseiaceae bacterium]